MLPRGNIQKRPRGRFSFLKYISGQKVNQGKYDIDVAFNSLNITQKYE